MNVGQLAPDFVLKDRLNKDYQLYKINFKKIVYFYPKDSTEGCTIEAKEFSSKVFEFEKMNSKVIGISGGNSKTKEKFCIDNNLKLTLLSDEDFKISKKYEVYGEKNFMGKKHFGIKRTTFILDEDNKIVKIFENVKPLGHAKEVLNFVKDLK